jgi:hypothetical protein
LAGEADQFGRRAEAKVIKSLDVAAVERVQVDYGRGADSCKS